MTTYGRNRSRAHAGSAGKFRPVKFASPLLARCELAAEAVGLSIEEWAAEAFEAKLEKTRWEVKEQRYRAACEDAAATMKATPLRRDFFPAGSGRR